MKIVADIDIPYIKGVLEPFAEVAYMKGAAIGRGDVQDADALLVRTRTRCDAALLAGSGVRFVGTATIGVDHIDTEWCRANGIAVASAAGSNAGGVLQWIGAALVRLAKMPGYNHPEPDHKKDGNESCDDSRNRCGLSENREPKDMCLGVVGVGNVGSLVAEYAREWGFRVICSDPPREEAEGLGRGDGFLHFEELAAQADVITFHVPLLPDGPCPTLGMGGEKFFGLLKNGAAVINSSRGGVVDEALLLDAIRRGVCVGCLDTWAHEPNIERQLLRQAYIATPHIAGYSAQGKANASAMIIEALAARFSLPLAKWYPANVRPALRSPISWKELARTITAHCDLAALTRQLKADPQSFESLRETYTFRQEYF